MHWQIARMTKVVRLGQPFTRDDLKKHRQPSADSSTIFVRSSTIIVRVRPRNHPKNGNNACDKLGRGLRSIDKFGCINAIGDTRTAPITRQA